MRIQTVSRNLKRHLNSWTIVSLIGAAVILLPIAIVLATMFTEPTENWDHVKAYLLVDYVKGSLTLAFFTTFFATTIGVVLAWLVVGYSFPLRGFFRWALLLPLALPPYIAAFTYRTMTSYTGVIQSTLRNQFGITLPPDTIEVHSIHGAIFILTFCLYPYVYLITRSFLERQSASYIENANLLGKKNVQLFWKVVLPIARPAIIAGMMLVIFEVLSDYGVASYFGVQTISTSIFQTWFGMYDVDSALRLAAWLMVIIIGVFILERFLRRNMRYTSTSTQNKPLHPKQLKGISSWSVLVLCSAIFLLAFAFPVIQIIVWAVWRFEGYWTSDFLHLMSNTLQVSIIATVIVVIFSIITARVVRTLSSNFAYGLSRLITAGYAVPGAIIAVGILAAFIFIDESLSSFYQFLGQTEGALVLSLSLGMLVTGYVIRFIAPGYNTIDSGYEKISKFYSEASRTLGKTSTRTFIKIELPLLKGTLLAAFILTFVEIIKELPLTKLLRPFNFETLATQAYKYAIDERIIAASLPSILLIIVSLVSVLIFNSIGKRDES
ncbi:ABC transporter permease [Aureibacillus halotolerans]|uniref:Iron(III) transport system permease protein n=1 Tax=Aureibacillus halotolerans TaxID=1508390 RepID=A0A4R6U202_9BACI|nr:iron ABC transporter permease [Aureibacillus halotolerans]TDQ38713.1 iron(III) transport system permease protein [Aureibacillus halotolerans]